MYTYVYMMVIWMGDVEVVRIKECLRVVWGMSLGNERFGEFSVCYIVFEMLFCGWGS